MPAKKIHWQTPYEEMLLAADDSNHFTMCSRYIDDDSLVTTDPLAVTCKTCQMLTHEHIKACIRTAQNEIVKTIAEWKAIDDITPEIFEKLTHLVLDIQQDQECAEALDAKMEAEKSRS